MAKKTVKSIEPNIANLVNGWLASYKLPYKIEQESVNEQIDNALKIYESKSGGLGGNRPDAKILLNDQYGNHYPILIEYKGYKDKLVKLDANNQVDNTLKHIKDYAVNGAVHYANALLHHTNYTDIIAIGITGHKDSREQIHHQIGVYFVSKSNFGVGQEVGQYSDLSFLKKTNFDTFVEKVKALSLTEAEVQKIKEQKDAEIKAVLMNLNNDIYGTNPALSTDDRLYLIAATIIATLGIKDEVEPLDTKKLISSKQVGETDADIILRTIKAFVDKKELPQEKKDFMMRIFTNTLKNESINKINNGETELKSIYTKIIDRLGIYYKIGLTTDFTGMLFNEIYSWIPSADNKNTNDVVLTPPYVATLLVQLARIDRDSYVWDFATGSAGLLVAAMNQMLIDAKNNITSPDELKAKERHIKAEQLLGLEILPTISMLAILNMILMGDGSSNIINKNSLTDFDGNYAYGHTGEPFPATAFILNPPYSAQGKGMVFVERALSMMNKGYAAIIIQNSAGSGAATEQNVNILKNNTLIASVKMPIDLFSGKSSVQTYIYVFRIGEAHQKDEMVKFIDFSTDGYERTNRKKAKINLRNADRATERYQELVNLVRFGKSKLNIYTEQEYHEDTIDPTSGNDWNKMAVTNTRPTLDDFKRTVGDYLAWEVSNILKRQDTDTLGK